MSNARLQKLIYFILLIAFGFELIRTAWISDDAAITLRTILNFTHGYGPTFNIDERVQAYTHPLWFMALTVVSIITNNVFTAAFILSICTSLVVFWLLLTKISTGFFSGLVVAGALILSKSYLDFSTSGLENPLSHLLILTSVLAVDRVVQRQDFRSLLLYFFCCSLIYLTRSDLLLILFPITIAIIIKFRKTPELLLKTISIGAIPAIAWICFSVYYYGFPFPNTAYAKLGTGIPLGVQLWQGTKYFIHTVHSDPLALLIIFLGVAIGICSSFQNRCLALGSILYITYIISIGGDFMEGRFLTTPIMISAVIVSRSSLTNVRLLGLAFCILILGAFNIDKTLLSGRSYVNMKIPPNGIADERGFFYQKSGLLTARNETFLVPDWTVNNRSVVDLCGGLGFDSIAAGPGAHFIDECALADPLLARLPALFNPNWRIGHYVRQLPTDYRESIATHENLLTDPVVKDYYDAIRKITRGPLISRERLRAIYEVNFGKIEKPDWNKYRNEPIPRSSKIAHADAANLNKPVDGGSWSAVGNVQFSTILNIRLDHKISFGEIDISVDNNDTYRIEVYSDGKWLEVATILPSPTAGMVRHKIILLTPTPMTDNVRVIAVSGDEAYSVGHFIVK